QIIYPIPICTLFPYTTLFRSDKCFRKHGNIRTAELLDYIKSNGYKFSTIGALTISMGDVIVPKAKFDILAKADKEVEKYEKMLRRSLVSENERYEFVISMWEKTTEELTKALLDELDPKNNIAIMATSGARGSTNQIRQLGGMRGLMSSAAGRTIEIPIKA